MSARRPEAHDESNSLVLQSSERHKTAKKKRLLQLKRYNQYEKLLDKSKKSNLPPSKKSSSYVTKEPQKEVRFVGRVRLLEAAARNDIEEVRQLLEAGVSPDVTNDDGLTAMHQCCIDNFEDMLCLLIEYGAKVNACDSELWTPLHAAAACGHLNLCKHLINNGADLMSVNCDGMMAYDICDNEATLDFIETEMTNRGITQQLIDTTRNLRELNMLRDLKDLTKQGFDLDWRGRNGETFLHIASCNGYLEVTQFLLQHPSVNIDAVDNELWQPVHCAVCWNQLGVLELLLVHGASLEAKTRNGETALDICEDEELRQQIEEMRDHWQRNKSVRSRDLVHKPNNVRSSSVRRSSMKQRKATSMKEALEEGKLLTTGSMATAQISSDYKNFDEDAATAHDNRNSCNPRNSFNLKDKIRGSHCLTPPNFPSDTRSNLDKERLHALLQEGRSCEEAELSLLANEMASSIKIVEQSTGNISYPANDNNNTVILGTPLPSALKKKGQLPASSSSTSSKSERCCTII